ncbi:uncharacterized protein LOC134024871 [Osmerus eperlanus]|uniref:uncharacterized protein LOC134024871 n=1 Tax=Osmerus eperlanus TaxID=29151 RepID=UPI002E0F54C5
MPDCHKSLGKKAIRCGLRGLLRQISPDYQVLCERVQEDTENIRAMDEETRRGSERLVKIEEETEGEMKGEISEGSEEASVVADSLESCRENGPPETTLHVLKRAANKVQFLSSAARTGSSSPELGELFVDGILNQLRESSPFESQLTSDSDQTEPVVSQRSRGSKTKGLSDSTTSPERTRPIEIRKPTATSEGGAVGFTRQDVKREATAIIEAFLNDIQALSETAGGPGAKPQALLFAFRLIDELQRKISCFYVQSSPDEATSEGEATPERTDSSASVAARRGSSSLTQAKKKSPILERIEGQRSTPVKTQRSKAFEFEQVTLPGTPIDVQVVFDSCPIVRLTTIDTGDDDNLPEESVDGSSETISRVVDSLLGSVKSDHRLLAPSNPRLDPARLRDLSRNLLDQLNALLTAHNKLLQLQTQAGERRSFSDTVLIKHHGNRGNPQTETAVPSELVYGFAERSVRRLLLPFLQEPVCSLTPSSCSSSQDSSEIFQQAVSLLSTVMVNQVIENLSGSSQSSTTGLGVQESESSTVGQDQEVSALLQVDKKKKKLSFFKKLRFSFKKSKSKPKAAQPDAQTSSHQDFI